MRNRLSLLLLFFSLVASVVPLRGQSPCDFDGIHPFCTDNNPMGITYPSGTGNGTAASFLGSSSACCLSSTPRPAWYYMKIYQPGSLLIYIEQFNTSHTGIDVDFACWGPFPTTDVPTFLTNLCNGTYNLTTSGGPGSHRPTNGDHSNNQTGGWPHPATASGNTIQMTDCSYYADYTEWCYIPNAQVGQIYLLLITNYNGSAGTINFNRVNVPYAQATTDCSVLEQIEDNSPLCEGQMLMLNYPETNPLPGLTYTWICPDGYSTTTTTPSFDRQNVTVAMGGRYKLIRRVGNNVGDTIFSADIDVTPTPTFTYSIAPETRFCEGETVNLTITVNNYPRAYYALNDESLPTTSQTQYDVPPFVIHNDTTFYIYASNSPFYGDGCYAMDTITFYCARTSSGLIEDQICVGQAYNNYNFTLPVQNVARDTLLEAHFSNGSGCDSVSQVLLHITSNPNIELRENTPEHCGLQDGYLAVTVTEGTGTLHYVWTPDMNGATDSLVDIHGGDYTLTVTDSLGCSATSTFTVDALPNPVACFNLIPEAPSYLVGEMIVFSNCSQYQTHNHWDLGDLNTSEELGLTYTYNDIGTYTITLDVTNDEGCSDTYSKTIEVHEQTRFYLPNSFTPNGDGINDVFMPVQMEVKEGSYSLKLFDRYGNLVFYTTDLNEGWDATINGKKVPTGSTFVYFTTYQDFDGTVYEKSGKVTVIY